MSFSALNPTIHAILRDDYRVTTFVLLGISIQSVFSHFSVGRYVALLAGATLLARFSYTMSMTAGLLHDTTQDKVVRGKVSAQLPWAGQGDEDSEEMVLFIIAARSNHPLSRFAPAFLQAGDHFQAMWVEAESDRDKWGYLGRSSDMLASDSTTGNAIVTLSYWKSMRHLAAFAQSETHKKGWDWFNRMTKIHPHLGFMHEVYAMPKGHWENIYTNMPPFGMGQCAFTPTMMSSNNAIVSSEEKAKNEEQLVRNLVNATGSRWTSMRNRMLWKGEI